MHGPADPLVPLSRREKAIQADLQLLLDAQSAGLVQGRGARDVDVGSDGGSSTPTSHSAFLGSGGERRRSREWRSGQVVPVRQPRKKPIALRAARRGILAAVQELGDIKTEEEHLVRSSRKILLDYLTRVTSWSQKISDFSTEMTKIHDGAENREVAELQNEKSAVENEIREVEERLLALRARDRNLGARIEELENRREAKISSFREGRRGVDAELKAFLHKPPVDDVLPVLEYADNGKGKNVPDEASEMDEMGDMFLSLPPKRRTLEMARSWLSASISLLTSQTSSIQKEKTALDEGAAMWEESVDLVNAFENHLRAQIDAGKGPNATDDGTAHLQSQISKMDDIVAQLDSKMQYAESQGWNLLICAIGAELEAFKEGRAILHGVLQKLQPPAHTTPDNDFFSKAEDARPFATRRSSANGDSEATGPDDVAASAITIEGLRNGHTAPAATAVDVDENDEATPPLPPNLERFDTAREAAEYRSESEDDGPHPDLLISQDDDDDDGPQPDLLVSRGL